MPHGGKRAGSGRPRGSGGQSQREAGRPERSTKVNKRPRLTTRQARFVEEFCVDFNATQAAIRAGYAAHTAKAAASRLRSQPAVAAAIAQAVAALKARAEASADRWLLEVLDIAYGNPGAKTMDGRPATRLTFGEKVRALELQGRALGFVKEGIELRAQTAIPIQIVHQEIE